VADKARRAQGEQTASARQACADVLAEAEALSAGMRRLGETLGSQAERMLRDVQAAHRQMQADLRVGGASAGADVPSFSPTSSAPESLPISSERLRSRESAAPRSSGGGASAEEAAAIERAAAAAAAGERGPQRASRFARERGERGSSRPPRERPAAPLDELEVPPWVERDGS